MIRNLCGECGRDFASVQAFDDHRVGTNRYTLTEGLRMEPPVEDGRRCLAEYEMADAGLGLDAQGRWCLVAAAARVRARRLAGGWANAPEPQKASGGAPPPLRPSVAA